MAGYRRMLAVLAMMGAVGLGCLASPAGAQPTADQILGEMGLSADDKQRVLNGEFVTAAVGTVAERDRLVAGARNQLQANRSIEESRY